MLQLKLKGKRTEEKGFRVEAQFDTILERQIPYVKVYIRKGTQIWKMIGMS